MDQRGISQAPANQAADAGGTDDDIDDKGCRAGISFLSLTLLAGRSTMTDASNSYHYRISLRVRHPDADPQEITRLVGILPSRFWQAGKPRQTPAGVLLQGLNPDTYWVAQVAAGRWPEKTLEASIDEVLSHLVSYREVFHKFRAEGGRAELSIGWFFEGQSGGGVVSQYFGFGRRP